MEIFMYTVESAEHFEDWFWASNRSKSFELFNEAMQSLLDNCLDVVGDISSGAGIDTYIAENHQENAAEDSLWDREYSKGFWFTIEIDGNQMLRLHLDYKTETSSISGEISIDIDEAKLTPTELAKVQQSLDTIRGALASKAAKA